MEPIPIYCEQAYAILYNKFKSKEFSSDYFKWFLSDSMRKKILYLLEKKGWIKRVKRGVYICNKPEEVITNMVKFRVPDLLELAGKMYCYTGMSAVEIWTDFAYVQRSWEHSPYFIKISKKDLNYWKKYFASHGISVFVKNSKPALGEFVILIPEDFKLTIFEEKPVDNIKEVVKFCKNNIELFEYPLAYLIKKFHLKVDVDIDRRIIEEVGRLI